MDGLTEQKMPEGIPEPRSQSQALCEEAEQTGNAERKIFPHVRLHRLKGLFIDPRLYSFEAAIECELEENNGRSRPNHTTVSFDTYWLCCLHSTFRNR